MVLAAWLKALLMSEALVPGRVVIAGTSSVGFAAKLTPTGRVPFSPLALMKPNAVTW